MVRNVYGMPLSSQKMEFGHWFKGLKCTDCSGDEGLHLVPFLSLRLFVGRVKSKLSVHYHLQKA